MISYGSITLIGANNIIELFIMKYRLQLWRYITNVSYFLNCPFSVLFIKKLYRTRPALNYALANDFLTLYILLALQKGKGGPVLTVVGGLIAIATALFGLLHFSIIYSPAPCWRKARQTLKNTLLRNFKKKETGIESLSAI